jgi:hypothetical protein
MGKELTNKEIEQIDFVDNFAFNMMQDFLGKSLEWDMQWIGRLADTLVMIAVEHFGEDERILYPYVDSEEE